MSTRCQVRVIQEGLEWDESVMLYHHTDGYPSYMLPKIKEAMDNARTTKYFREYELGKAGKVASYLCAVDPGVFEPESGFQLHGDIEYYYILYLINTTGGSMAEKPQWEIEIYVPDRTKDFWNNPRIKNMKPMRQSIDNAIASLGDKEI